MKSWFSQGPSRSASILLRPMMFSTFRPNHEIYVKTERGFSSWVNDGQKPLSHLSNSSFLAQKHHLNKTYPNVWNRGFVEMNGNEEDKGFINSWEAPYPLHFTSFRQIPCSTHRDRFYSNDVSEQEKMNLGKLREVFVQNRPRKKTVLHFLHRCHGFRETSKIQLPQENWCTSEVTLGKSIFILAWLAKWLSWWVKW